MNLLKDIPLNDVVEGTVFSIVGQEWVKGSSQHGAGPNGKTKCYPKMGGKFQTGEKFAEYLNNSEQIRISGYSQ